MAKSKGKDFLLEKGEKVGLGVAAGFGVLFIALGVMGMADRPQDPVEFSKTLENQAKNLDSKLNSPTAEVEELKGAIKETVSTKPVALVPSQSPFFDANSPPDGRRATPTVLGPVEGQADIATLKIPASDITLDSSGKITVGVLTVREKEKAEGVGKFAEEMRKRFGGKIPRWMQRPNAGQGGMAGGGPGFGGGEGGGFPGGGRPPGGGPPPGGVGGPPPGGGAGFMGGGPPGGAGFMGGGGPPTPGGNRGGPPPGGAGFGPPGFGGEGPGGSTAQSGDRLAVEKIEGSTDEEIEKKANGRRIAVTIQPQKMAVLQASFPYRAQLEAYRKALRYKEMKDLYAVQDDMPVFFGVDVQRRIYRPKGRELEMLQDWTSIDLAGSTQALRAVALYEKEDPADLKRVMLHEDHMLVMPLPHEIAGKYPEMNLKSLKNAITKLKNADPKLNTGPAPPSKYKGEGNPFRRSNGGAGSANAGLFGPGGEGASGIAPPGLGNLPKKGAEGTTPATTATNIEPPDFIYIRVYDPEIMDGQVYEYRLRAKLKNPNFGKHDLVSKRSDADNEELPPLEEHWYVFPQKVSVPQAAYHYVVEPKKEKDKDPGALADLRSGQAIVQFHRWYDKLDLGNDLREPIGDWVVADMIVKRGEYVSGKAFAPVPLWASELNEFVLRPVPGEKPPPTPKGKEPKEPRKGVLIEPVRSRSLLVVDVQGGKQSARIPQNNPGETKTSRTTSTQDESAHEVLFLLPDGSLDLRTSAYDKADTTRVNREKDFKNWSGKVGGKDGGIAPPPKKEFGF